MSQDSVPAGTLPTVDVSWLDISPKKKKRHDPNVPRRRKGRPSVSEEFPEVIPVASRFIFDNGFRAHRRRKESMGRCGSTVGSIKQHVRSTVPGLQESHPNLSNRTVARWMKPPNRSFQSSKAYQGLIDARVPAKENSLRKENANTHFYTARVKYFLECASMYNEEVLVYSADNKNKIKVGDATLAVDRRIKLRRIFPIDDKPNYRDHDFPTPGYTLTPSGYLELNPSTLCSTDNYGREHHVLPKGGSANIFLRSPHSPCNIVSHLNDLRDIISEKGPPRKSVLCLLVDGGPDFNVNHMTNVFFYSQFFKEADLDALIATSYCPGDSALNPVEHLWAPCTHALTSVYLPSTLEGESRPPCDQTGMTPEEKVRKEHAVFDNATAKIRDVYWKDLTFGGHSVDVRCIASGADHNQEHKRVKNIFGGSAKSLKDSDIYDDFKFCMEHIDRRIGTLIITKCTRNECHHCSRNPPTSTRELMDCLRSFPSPQPSPALPGHFLSFKESLAAPRVLPCEHQPIFREKGLGRCSAPGCRYVFCSNKDSVDHKRKFHK